MPIRAENRDRYPADWPAIAQPRCDRTPDMFGDGDA